MLDLLMRVEQGLGEMLKEDRWNTLYIDYEVPVVERVWTQYGDNRICLHRIHPCTTPYFHKHPWPSAMRIVEGTYKMDVGYGKGEVPPLTACTILLSPGSSYEMIEPDGWHSVNPIHGPVMSVMVIGRPLGRTASKKFSLTSLSQEKKNEILSFFRKKY